MSKELEALKRMEYFVNEEMGIKTFEQSGWHIEGTDDYQLVKEGLERLERIDNTKPSEALVQLKELHELAYGNDKTSFKIEDIRMSSYIKNYILKAQDQEKENTYIEKVKTMMKQKDCVLRYIESEQCFAVKTILSNGWYKLTPDFIDNNVREEIKPLPLIETIRQLKEEIAKYKKCIETLKKQEKILDIFKSKQYIPLDRLNPRFWNDKATYDEIVNYEYYLWLCENECEYVVKEERKLTKEEFDLLKEMVEDDNI